MTDINSVCLTGRITRDLGDRDFTYIANGTAKARFSIAVNKTVKNPDGSRGEKAAFFDVVVWGKPAETLKPYLTKGRKVTVQGRLEQDTWEDKQTRNRREKIYITADNVQIAWEGQRQGNSRNMPPDDEIPFEDDYPDGVYPDKVPF